MSRYWKRCQPREVRVDCRVPTRESRVSYKLFASHECQGEGRRQIGFLFPKRWPLIFSSLFFLYPFTLCSLRKPEGTRMFSVIYYDQRAWAWMDQEENSGVVDRNNECCCAEGCPTNSSDRTKSRIHVDFAELPKHGATPASAQMPGRTKK